jgi:transcriptional regulator with XRE-family HTH domain
MTSSDFPADPDMKGGVTFVSAVKGFPHAVFQRLPSGETVISGAMPATLGRRLAAVRDERKLTQGELAKRLGKSRATVNQYEAGTIEPPLKMVGKLAMILDVDPGLLAFGTPISHGEPGNRIEIVGVSGGQVEFLELSDGIQAKLRIDSSHTRAIELSSDASTFGLRRGDLAILDSSIDCIRGDGSLYAVRGYAGGLSIIRSDLHLEAGSARVRITLGQGQISEVDPKKVEVLGLVRATLRTE